MWGQTMRMFSRPTVHPRRSPVLRTWLLGIIAAVLTAGANARAAAGWTTASQRFTSGGRTIRVDCLEPTAPGSHPAILVLHGAGGTIFDGPEMRRVAARLAAAGNAAYVVHYFNRTGDFAVRDARMQENFDRWLDTVREAIRWAQGQGAAPVTGARPVGVYGYSLGAFLALAAASDNPRVGAVVEHAGGIWNGKQERIGRMPPVLLVHGRADGRVPFTRYALPLVDVLKRRGATFETRFVPGETHRFTTAAQAQVREEAVAFFARRLRAP